MEAEVDVKNRKRLVCLFCCKILKHLEDEDDTLSIPPLKPISQFMKLFQRYVGTNEDLSTQFLMFQNIVGSAQNGNRFCSDRIEACPDCEKLMSSFCELYDKIKCSELEIQWRTQVLLDVMKEASRVPSRMKLLQQVLGDKEDDLTNENETNRTNHNFRHVMKFRKTISENGCKILSKPLPRVILHKLDTESRTSTNPNLSSSVNRKPETTYKSENYLSEWLASFSVVVMLLSLLPSTDKIVETPVIDLSNDYVDNNCLERIQEDGVNNSNSNTDTSSTFEENQEQFSVEMADYQSQFEDSNDDEEIQTTSVDRIEESKNVIKLKVKQEIIEPEPESRTNLTKNVTNSDNAVRELKREKGTSCPERKIANKPFSCIYCPTKYSRKGSLRPHLRLKHADKIKRESPNENRPFKCKVCNNKAFNSYRRYFEHTKRFEHQVKLKRLKKQKSEGASSEMNGQDKTLEVPNLPTDNISDLNLHRSKRYNLRTQRTKSIPQPSSSSEDTSSSSSYSSSSSSDEDDNKLPKAKSKSKKKHYCHLDGCKYRAPYSKRFDDHQKLHELGNYPCDFCTFIENNAYKLSIHEIQNHSKKPSERKRNSKYYCPRCEYQTSRKILYINHFSEDHLNFSKVGFVKCKICHLEVRGSQRHFKLWHDTNGLNPSEIWRCREDNCKAYFTKLEYFQRHNRQFHSNYVLSSSSDEEDVELKHSAGKLRCNLCEKTFRSEFWRKQHKHIFHKNLEANGENIAKSLTNNLICPNLKCSKSFKRLEHLEKHRKLHGNFKCGSCDIYMEYAPDLATHELEHSGNVNKNFKCSKCFFSSKFESVYVAHYLEKHLNLSDKFYECSICHARLSTASSKRNHFTTHHQISGVDPNYIERCPNCPAYFLRNHHLKLHQEHNCVNKPIGISNPNTGHTSRKHHCLAPNCNRLFKYLEELEKHAKLHGNFKCSRCDFISNYAPDLADHEATHVEIQDKYFRCARCTYSAKRQNLYQRHFIEKHLGLDPRMYICPICKFSFCTDNAIFKHTRTHHKIKGVDPKIIQRCDKCPAYFLEKIQLIQHKRVVHDGITNRSVKCNLCEKLYKSRQSLASHRKLVHGVGKSCNIFGFPCDLPNCSKRFQSEDEMLWHKQHGHSMEDYGKRKRPESELNVEICQKCGKECKGKIALKLHMKVHRDDRLTEWKCDKCTKIFKSKAQLEAHLEFHKGPEAWKFMCAICSKKCVTKHALEQHMNTHTKAKPFVCQVCGIKYAHRHNLRNHVNTKHKDEGIQDVPKKVDRKYFVSRKGKKLGDGFCFTRDQDGDINEQQSVKL